MFCADCGNSLQENFTFCPHCGKALNGKADGSPDIKDIPDTKNNQSMSVNVQKSGNSTLKAFGIVSIIFGPIIAFYMGFDTYQSARQASIRWGASARGAAQNAANALMDTMSLLVIIVAASLIIGIIFLVMGRKK